MLEMRFPGEHGPVAVKLENLVVDESLPKDAFSIPKRREGVADRSEEYRRQLTVHGARLLCRRLHELANENGFEDRFESTVLREKLIRVAELAHAELIPELCAPWSEKITSGTTEFFQAWRAEYERQRGDEAARKALTVDVEEFRAQVTQAVAKNRAGYLAQLGGPPDARSSVAAVILECEREAAGRVFDREMGEKLLAAIDDAHRAVVGDG